MDIFTAIMIFLVIEAGLYGICCFMCRERHVPSEREEQSKIHHSALHPPRITHVGDPQQPLSHPPDHPSHRQENTAELIYFPSRISSLRDCE